MKKQKRKYRKKKSKDTIKSKRNLGNNGKARRVKE